MLIKSAFRDVFCYYSMKSASEDDTIEAAYFVCLKELSAITAVRWIADGTRLPNECGSVWMVLPSFCIQSKISTAIIGCMNYLGSVFRTN